MPTTSTVWEACLKPWLFDAVATQESISQPASSSTRWQLEQTKWWWCPGLQSR
jgi:hypothetical protein